MTALGGEADEQDAQDGPERREGEGRDLRRGEWKLLAVLGLPTFAYALATTVVTTYLPVLASTFSGSTTVIGLLIGIEGLMALLLALPGSLSDRVSHRQTFIIGGSPVLVVALALLGCTTSLGLAALLAFVFFGAYFVAYEPYRALYPDLVSDEVAGRGQSSQALWRGLATLVASGWAACCSAWPRCCPSSSPRR